MLGFAIVDNQPAATATAIWLTSRLEGSQVGHTNAVVIRHDDERHDTKVWNVTADRAVVLTTGTAAPIAFKHTIELKAFDSLLAETSGFQKRIIDAVAEYAGRTKSKNLVGPAFTAHWIELKPADHDEPAYRALSAANYVRDVWAAWLATDEQRLRRTINPRSGRAPWIMPDDLGATTLAEFPPEFGQRVKPEPLVKPAWVA